ncbi:MAG: Hsp33 family molecular chaperone HslO [Thermodesulfobacteriota bacterium]
MEKKLYGGNVKEQHKAAAEDRLFHFVLQAGRIRGVIVKGIKMIREMRGSHQLGILETMALGHAYLGAVMMAAHLKGDERLQIRIDCSGPAKGLVVESNAFGEVRGYLKQVPIPIAAPLEDFDLSPFLGAGTLTVTKYLKNAKQPYSGQVLLQYGNIAQDLANYLLTSEQIPSALYLSVQFNPAGEIVGAGGLLLQALPGAEEKAVEELEGRIRGISSLGNDLAGKKPDDLILDVFQRFSPKMLDSKRVEFMCHCSRERLGHYLMLLPEKDLQDIRLHGPFPLEMRCHFCNSVYAFSAGEIEEIHRRHWNREPDKSV